MFKNLAKRQKRSATEFAVFSCMRVIKVAHASAKKIGPALICERLWQQLGIRSVIHELVVQRKYRFDVERAIFLTVLHRLFVSGSDRSCNRWHRDY